MEPFTALDHAGSGAFQVFVPTTVERFDFFVGGAVHLWQREGVFPVGWGG